MVADFRLPERTPPSTTSAFSAAVLQCAKRTLPNVSRPSVRRLADDLELVSCSVRAAVLWDHTAWDDGVVAMYPASSGPHALVDALKACCSTASELKLLSIGPSLFVVHAQALTNLISQPLPGASSGAELIAIDAHLLAPRPCDDEERLQVCAALHVVANGIAHGLDQRCRAPALMEESIMRVPAPEPAATMVAVHGWLLGYPVIYCYADAQRAQASTAACCLGGHPLSVIRLTASREGQHPPKPCLVCSFSMPAHHAGPALDRPALQQWCAEVRQRIDQQTAWRVAAIEVEERVQEAVVL